MSLSLPFAHPYNHLNNTYLSNKKLLPFTVWTCWVLCIHNPLKSQGLFSVLNDFVVIVGVGGGEGACLPSAQVPASCWGSWSIENSCLPPSSLLCRFPCLQVTAHAWHAFRHSSSSWCHTHRSHLSYLLPDSNLSKVGAHPAQCFALESSHLFMWPIGSQDQVL